MSERLNLLARSFPIPSARYFPLTFAMNCVQLLLTEYPAAPMSVLHGTGQRRRFLCLPDRPMSQQGPPVRELVLTSTVDPPGSATWRMHA